MSEGVLDREEPMEGVPVPVLERLSLSDSEGEELGVREEDSEAEALRVGVAEELSVPEGRVLLEMEEAEPLSLGVGEGVLRV